MKDVIKLCHLNTIELVILQLTSIRLWMHGKILVILSFSGYRKNIKFPHSYEQASTAMTWFPFKETRQFVSADTDFKTGFWMQELNIVRC
jgi:uncharacterized membrane protein YqhA